MSRPQGQKARILIFTFLLSAAFLIPFFVSRVQALQGDYGKPQNGTLFAGDWNTLPIDFVKTTGTSTINGGNLLLYSQGGLGGIVQAVSFNGPLNGPVGASNVTSGEFGSAYGGGSYFFGTLGTGVVGIGTTTMTSDARLSIKGVGTNNILSLFNSSGGGVFTVQGSGKVGIGTVSPAEMLEVNGAVYLDPLTAPSPTTNRLYNVSGNLFWNGLQLGTGSGDYWKLSGSNLYASNTAWNVGIGTSTPGYKLSVLSGASNTLTYPVQWGRADGAVYGLLGQDAATDNTVLIGSGSNHNLALITNRVRRLTLDTSGNVGIGTTTPTTKLDVIGTGAFGNMVSSRGLYGNGLSVQNNSGSATSLFLWQSGVGSGHIGFRASDNNLYIVNSLSDGLITNPSFIALNSSGRVGIGDTLPGYSLVVNGTTSVATDIKSSILGASCYSKPLTVSQTGVITCLGAASVAAKFVGLTSASYAGNNNGTNLGYFAAHNICNNEYSGSHVCSAAEILNTIASGSLPPSADAWVFNGPPGYFAPVSDCEGRTSNLNTKLGAYWQAPAPAYPEGRGLLSYCNASMKLACCR